jgi:5-methylcytosine-specific restriction protein A
MESILSMLRKMGKDLMNELHLDIDESKWMDKNNFEKFKCVNEHNLTKPEHCGLLLTKELCLTFHQWDDTKPTHIVLWKKGKTQPLFELDLSSVVQSQGSYTCYLKKPTHSVNKLILKKYPWESKIDRNYRDILRIIRKGFKQPRPHIPQEGYLLGENVSRKEIEKALEDLLKKIIKSHGGPVSPTRKKYSLNSRKALEGYLVDSIQRIRTRNQGIIDSRKKRDGYRCQACGLKLKVKGKYIIECHHKEPLAWGERETKIDDLVCLCPTCHRVAHMANPPYLPKKISALRKDL